MKDEITYWNDDAKNYDSRAKKSAKAYQEIIELIKTKINLGMSILDIGTGTGEVSLSISTYAKQIDAIDFSSEMIKIATEKSKLRNINNIKFLVGDCTHPQIKNSTYDVILIINLIHVIENPEFFLNSIKKNLNQDGLVIIATYLHNENLISRIISYLMSRKGHPIYSKFNQSTICRTIQKCNYRISNKKFIKNVMPMYYIEAKSV